MISGFSKRILGLDIRSHYISAVLVRSSLKGLWLEDGLSVDIQPPLTESGEGFSRAMEAVLSRLDAQKTVCAASFPFKHPLYRNIAVPFSEKKKIRQIISFELEPMVPRSLEDYIVDFQTLQNGKNPEHQTDLLVGAVLKDEVRQYIDALVPFGVDPETIGIGCQTTAVVLEEKMTGISNWVLLDMEPDHVDMAVAINRRVCMMRSFSIPADVDCLPLFVSTRILHTVLAVRDQFGEIDFPEKVLITGSLGENADIQEAISTQLDIPVQPANLTSQADIRLTREPEWLEKASRFNTAFALCMAEADSKPVFNFRKGSLAIKKFWTDHSTDIVRTGIFAGILLILLGMGHIVQSNVLKKNAEALDRQIIELFESTFPGAKTVPGTAIAQMQVKIQEKKKTALFSDETSTHVRSIEIINEISRLTPKEVDVVITNLVVSPGNVTISGDTATFNMVDDLKGRLEKSDFFSEVIITSANLNKSGNRVDFKLKLQTG
jgi:general secretion pathway protein L